MNINELDSYNLADAVKFNNELNPRMWQGQQMRPAVRDKLLEIAADFKEFMGLSDLEVEDITVSGSNAGYTYTPHSDIDLHLVVRMPEQCDEVYQELFNAKKYQYNDEHDIRIGGHDVELYVQPADQPHVSAGVYSVKNNDWIHIPRKIAARVDDESVRNKYEDVKARIDSAMKSNNAEGMRKLWHKIKDMRKSGLAQNGELGPENLAFKMLRTQGDLGKLKDAIGRARDAELSLTERRKKKKKSRVKYGFGGYWYPGFAFGGSEGGDSGGDGGGGESQAKEDVTSTPDGVSPSTKMFLSERPAATQQEIIEDFLNFVVKELNISDVPRLRLKRDPAWSIRNRSFGRYDNSTGELIVALGNRHIMDILRTLAHELTHRKQDERENMPPDAGATGSAYENEANARAGILMRKYAELHPEYFEDQAVNESSGYIPTAAEKNDPRFVMALSPDVRPGATGKNANRMALKTDSQGRPALLMKTANLREGRMPQPNQVPGPETPPTMPAGTVRVDVSDMYDWYKLGQHISNMKGLGKHDFGAGPPASIISFGDEETEHKFIQDLKRTGLDVTDIDPKDPKQPRGMPKIKTDPTYNVDEDIVESLRQEFSLLEDEYVSEIKMTGKNLRAEAAKTGALAGMEFEMIVPNVETDVEPEYEPDMDQDQRARSFSDVRDFFHDGDYNGRRQVDNLMEELTNEYEEWMQEQTAEQWERDGVDYIRDFVEVNDLFDRDEAMAEARDEVMTANPDLPQESEDFQKLVSARVDELQEQFVLEAFEDRGSIYDDAFEAFAEEQRDEYDEGSFLDDRYQTMSDIQSNFDISWPYYYDINDGQDGELDIDQVADDFSNSIGKPVNASRSYHGARREPGHYVVEPDGSLEGDNPGDGGLEFVSPPMPIDELLSDLNKVKKWADREGCYTNDSTGLHINISVPDYSIDKLDYVKLAILMGDEYILDLFGRSGNTYAKSAMGKIKSALKQKPEAAAQIMDLMKQGLDGAATKAIHTGITDKYTSINTKTGYIEFRSPGGDWLDSNFANIENTLLRFTVALSAAINPEAYRKEYLTKLYKLLSEGMDKSDTDVIQLFSNYSAGELDKPALIRQVRQKQLARNVAKGKTTGKMWWKVSNPANSFASIEVVADNAEEAIDNAILPGNYPDWARVKNTLRATPLRPYTAPAAQSKQGSWGIWLDGAERFVRIPRSEDGGDGQALRRFDSESTARTWLNNYRDRNPGVRTDISIREIPADYQWPPADAATSQTQTPAVPQGGNTGDWGVWVPSLDRYATIGNAGPRRFDTEADAQAWIQDYNTRHSGNDIGLVARQVAAAQPEFQEPDASRGNLTPRGPGPWEIYRISDGSMVRVLDQTNRQGAETEARTALGLRGEAPELYGVRTRQIAGTAPRSSYELFLKSNGRVVTASNGNPIVFQATDPDDAANKIARYVADFNLPGHPTNYDVRSVLQPAQQDASQGGTVDVAGEQPAQAPQTLTRPGQGQQQWTGEWLILDPNDRVIHRFGGVGNVQADANRIAMDWLRRNPRHMQAGVTVAPEMQ